MPWSKGKRIPTNLIVGFLGSGKTTAISRLLSSRPGGENWAIFVNEFGKVSIDHALVNSDQQGVFVEELGGGCACCTMSFVFQPLLARFIRRSKPDRLILEPSGISHPAKVVDILRGPNFSNVIDLRNVICLIDPQDLADPKRQNLKVFQDQVQLADIVVINWTDSRCRELVDRCRSWVENFDPPKQLIVETSFGEIANTLLDEKYDTIRFPLFSDAHSTPKEDWAKLSQIGDNLTAQDILANQSVVSQPDRTPEPRNPLRFVNERPNFSACGWIFHIDDIFDRQKLNDLLSAGESISRLKGVFRCEGDWWMINRAKESVDMAESTYRRDSRLEVILSGESVGPVDWEKFEVQLLQCLVN